MIACLAASAMYGLAANYTKRRLAGMAPLAVAAGSQIAATLFLAVPAWLWWPAVAPPRAAWGAMAMLAFAFRGIAYLMYFRLIAHIGPANAIAVTYLVPLFAMVWGGWLLDEAVTALMLGGAAVILLGTALATGKWCAGRHARRFSCVAPISQWRGPACVFRMHRLAL